LHILQLDIVPKREDPLMTDTQYVATVPFKAIGTSWLLFIFLGGFSAHQFYLENTGKAWARLLTLQYLTIAIWIDLFTLNKQVRGHNAALAAKTGVPSPTA